jgi:phosphoglycolate phosphatase
MARSSLLFDLDGTLTDPKEGIVRSIRYALELLGKPQDQETDFTWCIGPPLQQSFARILGEDQRDLVSEAVSYYRQRYGSVGMFENKVYPGIAECLCDLSRDFDLYVATSKPHIFARTILDHFRLSEPFRAIYGAELDGTHSDKADLVRHILARESLDPRTTFMIGDRMHDIVGARKNGVAAFGVAWGYGSVEELTDAGAERIFRTPGEIAPFFSPAAPGLSVDTNNLTQRYTAVI